MVHGNHGNKSKALFYFYINLSTNILLQLHVFNSFKAVFTWFLLFVLTLLIILIFY